jgi:hypothetical protein
MAEQKIWKIEGSSILTVVFVNTPMDSICRSIECDVADTEALPISQQANEILSDFAAPNMEAESLVRRLDV